LQPFDPREAFFLLDVALVALIGRSGKECRKGMHELNRTFEQAKLPLASAPRTATIGATRTGCENVQALLKARCGLCPHRCKAPLA
jgi:hypothetical protein